MPFIDLPVDVLALIFDRLTQRDLKKVRLVCRALQSVVKLRVSRVFLSPNRTNINAFRGIAAKKEFRDQVREIVWDDARLEYYERERLSRSAIDELKYNTDMEIQARFHNIKYFQHFQREIERQKPPAHCTEWIEEIARRKEELWGPGVQDMSLDDCFDLYNPLYDEQQAIIDSGEDVESLT